jgi:hypothetical protein
MNIHLSRSLTRWIHLAGAGALGTFAYSPWRNEPILLDLVRFGVFPLLAASGLWLWLGARWLARRRKLESAAAVPVNTGIRQEVR